ncbi:DMT family transporter [Helcococcus bovis]|uniref:DMT family transporter n=1 Tax=Helcococcus bovis TaxID=3153252 RepID=UPI0038B96008
MINGFLSGILWALDTVILSIALASTNYISTPEALMFAPFVSTFLHDLFSTMWMTIITIAKKQTNEIKRSLKTRSGKIIILGALLGGPIGMSGYVIAINNIGPGLTSIISSIYPAVGVLFSIIFLKEKVKPIQLFGLTISILGVIFLSYQANGEFSEGNSFLGFIAGVVCCVGWASEAVIVGYGMKDEGISDENALFIRQISSSLFYGVVILIFLGAWKFTFSTLYTNSILYVLLAGIFGTMSYLMYYKAINKIGASKAMPLNITYTAWAVFFSYIILKQSITLYSIILGIVIILGSILSSVDLRQFRK